MLRLIYFMFSVCRMASTAELVQNVIDTVDNASSQRLHLSELLDCLQEAKQQVSMASTAELVQNVIWRLWTRPPVRDFISQNS